MKHIHTDTLIIGAGPAGLAAAIKLAEAGKDFVIIEKSDMVGGLAKTRTFVEGDDVFLTDQGPHRFFSKNPELYHFIEDLLQERWIKVKRYTRQYIAGKFYDYPLKPFQALKNIGPWKAAGMLYDYAVATVRYKLLGRPLATFADYVYANFGKSLGKFCMINYTEKIWGLPAEKIHPDWASQRLKGLSVYGLLKDFLRISRKKDGPKSLIDTFYYPERGAGEVYEAIQKKLEALGYTVLTKTQPTKIFHENNKITAALCQSPEGEIRFTFNHLIESVPIKNFVTLFEKTAVRHVSESMRNLSYRHQVYLFITLNKPKVTDDQWIYFPETHIPIGRMSEMKNFSQAMAPADKTSLFLEFFCSTNDAVWKMGPTEVFELAVPWLEQMGFVTRTEVRRSYVFKEENVYPVYDLGYKKHLEEIKNFLNKFNNLLYVGRPGRFKYNNQDHSLEMGFLAAQSIIDGHPYDIEAVGEDKKHYESGTIYDKRTTH